jgi:hypothetical protein
MPQSVQPPKAILFDIGGVVVRLAKSLTKAHSTVPVHRVADKNLPGNKPFPGHSRLRNREQDSNRLHQLCNSKRSTRHGRVAAHRTRRSRAKRCLVHLLQSATLATRNMARIPRQGYPTTIPWRRRWLSPRGWQTPSRPRHKREETLLAHDEDLSRTRPVHVSRAA